MTSTNSSHTGDLDLARTMLASDDFLEGHTGIDAAEALGDAKPSEPGTVSVHLNGDVVDALLKARGWKHEARYPQIARAWHAPDGGGPYWHRDEALRLALTAEVV